MKLWEWKITEVRVERGVTTTYYKLTFFNMTAKTKAEVLRYARSIAITFLAGFAIEIVPELNELTLSSLKDGTLIGLLFVGVRTGVKMVLEAFLLWYRK